MDINNFMDALKASLATSLDVSRAEVKTYLADTEIRVQNLTDGAASGHVSFKSIAERLAEEKENLQLFLLAMSDTPQSMLQGMVSSIINSLIQHLFDTAIEKI